MMKIKLMRMFLVGYLCGILRLVTINFTQVIQEMNNAQGFYNDFKKVINANIPINNQKLEANIIAINIFKNNLSRLILDYEQAQSDLSNALSSLIELEDQISGLNKVIKSLFNDFIIKKDITIAEQYDLLNIILNCKSILNYKNTMYKERKKSLEAMHQKINKLSIDINVLIKEQKVVLNS